MEKGRYFSKPRLLSDKLQELMEGLESADNIGLLGYPKSMFAVNPPPLQQYQEHYHSVCGPSAFYRKFYGITDAKGTSKQQAMPQQNPKAQNAPKKAKQKKKASKAAKAQNK